MTRSSGKLDRCPVVFQAGDPPRTGSMVFWDVADDAPDELTVIVPGDAGVHQRVAPALRLPVGDAVPLLATSRSGAHPTTEFWGAATALALRLLARGRLLPWVSPGGFDAWRVGPLDPADVERIRLLAAAMPPEARAAPLPGHDRPTLADPLTLLRGFLDAVADALPRTPAAARMTGMAPFADAQPQRVPQLRGWADELDPETRVSLRVELDVPDGSFRVVLQVHDESAMVTDAAELWTDGARSRAQLEVTLAVRRAARVWPVLERLLEHPVPDRLALGDDEVQELISAAPRLDAAGVAVHWPAELARELTARAVVGGGDAPPVDSRGFLGGDQLCTVDWQLALRGQPLTEAELDELARAHRPLVRLREEWVLLDQELARKARERELKPLAPIDALGAALSGVAEVDGEHAEAVSSGWLETLRQRVTESRDTGPDTGPDTQPAALAATLRDYQLRGLRWLARMTSLGLGGCLADDMGLGKTITLIALHLHRKSEVDGIGPTLVVCPASLLGNWEREIRRFAPGTPVQRFHGTHRSLDISLDGTDDGFVLTTYGTMRVDAARLAERHWGLLVADEAQHVKNPLSSTARALRTIPSDARVALTGTPVENDLTELWAILDWTTPGLLSTRSTFRMRWAQPIQSERDGVTTERLSRLIRPFLLRRRKSDPGIAPELPAKTETDQPVALTREQAALYEAVVREIMAQVRSSEGMSRRGLIVKLFTRLKQVCNHPAQYLKESEPVLTGRSGKLELLDELVDTITAADGSVLVFTQYVAMARLIERHLTDRGVGVQLLHGGTPVPGREEMVRRFQHAEPGELPVFLLSLKAAGTGLNLTRAEHVVHYDRWWNPAVEDQATDRAHRIGQMNPVQVHRLITEGTVEDRIAEMLASKRELADAVLSSTERDIEAALTELSDAELADLVELGDTR